jgi:palmitoyltransferase ZDHHC13/17
MLGKEEEATMSRLATGLHWLSDWSLSQVMWSAFMLWGLVLFSQLVMAMVPRMFPSLSHLAMLSPS